MNNDTQTVQATKTSFAVLEVLRDHEGAGVTEVADALGIPKSTAHKHLNTLVGMGYAIRDEGIYDIGMPFVLFGQYARSKNPLFNKAQESVEQLSKTVDEVAGLFVKAGGRGFDIYRSDGNEMGRLPTSLHCTAPGKAILAELSDSEVDDIIEQNGLPRRTNHTITERGELDLERKRIRERGIAFDREESREGVHGVAVPIRQGQAVRGAIYVIGTKDRLTGKWFVENIPGIILSTVNTVEQLLREQ